MELKRGNFTFIGDAGELASFLKETKADTFEPEDRFIVSKVVFCVVSLIFIVSACIVWLYYDALKDYMGIAAIILLALCAIDIACCQGCYRNKLATIICSLTAIMIYIISMHVMTPEEVSNKVKDKAERVIDQQIGKD